MIGQGLWTSCLQYYTKWRDYKQDGVTVKYLTNVILYFPPPPPSPRRLPVSADPGAKWTKTNLADCQFSIPITTRSCCCIVQSAVTRRFFLIDFHDHHSAGLEEESSMV